MKRKSQPIKKAIVAPTKNEEQFTSVKHLANIGDIIASLAACKKFYDTTGRRIRYMQCVDNPAQYYNGAVHPTVDRNGVNVSINEKGFEMLKPLVEAQEYIHSFVKFEGQKVDLDFDVIRGQTDVNMPHGMLAAWIFYAFPDLACDISTPWITLPAEPPYHIKQQVSGKILINFTERYRNHFLNYFFLKNYAPDLVFSGTEKEHWLFCNQWQLDIPLLKIADWFDIAYALRECRFLLANQSSHWNLSNSMGTPRLLEVCKWADNCQPFCGPDSYGYYYQMPAEYFFRTMYNKTAKTPTEQGLVNSLLQKELNRR